MKKGKKDADAPSRKTKESIICYILVGFVAFTCILPLWIALVASLSDETEIVEKGFSLLPRSFTLETYKFIIENKGAMLLRAYGMSFAATILGTVISTSIMTLYAYAASQKKTVFRFAGVLSFFAWCTMIFI